MENSKISEQFKENEQLNSYDKNNGKITPSLIKKNNLGNSLFTENILNTIQTNEINIENSTIIGTKLIEADNNDERYLKAIKKKNEVAILKDENKLIEILQLKTLEKILRFLGSNLKEFYYDISFGIYSCEEIVELRKTLDNMSFKKENFLKHSYNYNKDLTHEKKLRKTPQCKDLIFDTVQKEIDLLNQESNISKGNAIKFQDQKEQKLICDKEEFTK